MRLRALWMACVAPLALAGAAAAEPAATPANPNTIARPNAVVDGLPPGRIVAMVRTNGFDPVGRPVRNGNVYTLRALDPYDVEYRLVIDAHTGRMVSMREVAMPGAYYEAVPAFGRIFGRSDDGYPSPRPPRDVPHVAPQVRHAAPPPQPSAATAPPLPRPRPYVMEATGSIPVDPTPAPEKQKDSEPQKGNGSPATASQ